MVSSSTKTLSCAVIGAGLIGNVHVANILKLGHKVNYIGSRTRFGAQKLAQQWNVLQSGVGIEPALEPGIDVVHICTPPVAHFEMVKKALEAGKHVICEKPLCIDASESKILMDLAAEKALKVGIVYNNRFYNACKTAQKTIQESSFGRVLLVHGHYLQAFHVLPDEYTWRYKPEQAGRMRATTEIGSHWIDLMRFWTGLEIISISANFGYAQRERTLSNGMMHAPGEKEGELIQIDSEDFAGIAFRLTNGAIGQLVLSEIAHGRNNQLKIEVSGQYQSIWWENENPYTLFSAKGKFNGINANTWSFTGGFDETFYQLFQQVYHHILEGGEADYPTVKDGWINNLVCDAIYKSAHQNGKWIDIPYTT